AHEAVHALDAALEVVPREAHVLLALRAGAAVLGTGAADGGDHEVSLAQPVAGRALDHAQVLVPEDQVRAARRGLAVERLLDLDVGAADPRLQNAHERLAVGGSRIRDVVADLEAVRLPGHDGHGAHRRNDITVRLRGMAASWSERARAAAILAL